MRSLALYQTAWLCGEADRVAVTALAALIADGRLVLAPKRQRVKVGRDEPEGKVEAAALALVPDTGLRVSDFLDGVRESEPVAALAKKLRLAIWTFRLSNKHRGLRAESSTGARRVAIHGIEGVEDDDLREVLENPLPGVRTFELPKPPIDNSADGANNEIHPYTKGFPN